MAKITEKENLQKGIEKAGEKLGLIDAVVKEKKESEQAKTSKKQKLVNFYLSEEKEKEYRKIFGAGGISLSQGIRMSLDYTATLLKSGKLVLSDYGLHENLLEKL